MDRYTKDGIRSSIEWLLLVVLLVAVAWFISDRVDAQKVTTCESVIAEIDGVYWNFPNSWINGALICYDGPRDTSTEVITIEREVTFKGSRKALEQIGVL